VETLEGGWNVLTPIDEQVIIANILQPLVQKSIQEKDAFGDGRAADKIVKLLENFK